MTEFVVGTVEETLENKHQAKDGLWYPSYQDKAAANKRRNWEVLKEKNLVSFSDIKKVSPSPPKKKRKAAAPKAPTEIRKSRRLRKEPASYKPLEFLEEEPRAPRKPRSPRKSKPKGLSEEDMEKLKNLPDWLDEMEEFLLTVPHGSSNKPISSDNCRTVMRQVKLLVSGVGVGYRWWPNGVVFKKNIKINLDTNLYKLYDEAQEMEDKYGRDKGNGWLLRHPISKLLLYQQYRFENL